MRSGDDVNAWFTLRRLPLAALLLAGLAACSSLPRMPSLNPIDWFTASSTGPKPSELPALSNVQEVKRLWAAGVGAAGRSVFTPALSRDSVPRLRAATP